MIDHEFKVYLIEVNTNPCIETTCPILQKVITDMLDSGFRIAIDPLFPPPNLNKRMNVSVPLTQWELIFDADIDS
jgi:tubulin--tyrosine ligase